jgi:hypothetical protein
MTTPIITRNLSKEPPSSPRERLAGFVILKRTVDKCRARIDGTLGEYHYDCPLDNLLFSFKGITATELQTVVREAKSYEEVGAWLNANGTAKSAAQIQSWSEETEAASPIRNPEKRASFIQACSSLGLNPQMHTTFDWLLADDRETFRPKPGQPGQHNGQNHSH